MEFALGKIRIRISVGSLMCEEIVGYEVTWLSKGTSWNVRIDVEGIMFPYYSK